MKSTQCVVVGVMVLACLAMAAPDVVAGKPPKPTPTPTPSPTPAPPPTIAYVELNTRFLSRPLMVASEDGSGITRLYGGDGLVVAEPAWSPDGEWIAFNSSDNTTGERWLNVIRPDGTGLTRIAPRCTVSAGAGTARVQGPSWQPVDDEHDGRYWLVYRDATFPDGVPGVDCDPGPFTLRWIWAVEVNLAQPAAFDPINPPRFVYLPSPDPYSSWDGNQAVWSWDGLHLAAVQWPEGGGEALIVYDVDVDPSTGVPQLANPMSLTPGPVTIEDVAWANWSDTLIVSGRATLLGRTGLWMCAVDFAYGTCFGGWTQLTPEDNEDNFMGACFSSNDTEIVVSQLLLGSPHPVADLLAGPYTPLALQLLVPAPRFTRLIQPDWRPGP